MFLSSSTQPRISSALPANKCATSAGGGGQAGERPPRRRRGGARRPSVGKGGGGARRRQEQHLFSRKQRVARHRERNVVRDASDGRRMHDAGVSRAGHGGGRCAAVAASRCVHVVRNGAHDDQAWGGGVPAPARRRRWRRCRQPQRPRHGRCRQRTGVTPSPPLTMPRDGTRHGQPLRHPRIVRRERPVGRQRRHTHRLCDAR